MNFREWLLIESNKPAIKAKELIRLYVTTKNDNKEFPPGYFGGSSSEESELHDMAAVIASAMKKDNSKPMCLIHNSPDYDSTGVMKAMMQIGRKYGLIGGYIEGGSYVYGQPDAVHATAEAGDDDHETIGRSLGFPEKEIEKFVGGYGLKYRGKDIPAPKVGKLYDKVPSSNRIVRASPPGTSYEGW